MSESFVHVRVGRRFGQPDPPAAPVGEPVRQPGGGKVGDNLGVVGELVVLCRLVNVDKHLAVQIDHAQRPRQVRRERFEAKIPDLLAFRGPDRVGAALRLGLRHFESTIL